MTWFIETFDEVSSTQDLARLRAAENPELSHLAIIARSQNAGRGRHGRQWISEKGNLYCSLVLRPQVALSQIGSLALVVGLALYQSTAHEGMILKWPNDLLLDGKKCAGILLETQTTTNGDLDFVIIGMGVNLVTAPAEGVVLGGDPDELFKKFLHQFDPLYTKWHQGGFEAIRDDWLGASYPIGTTVGVKLGKEIIKGEFLGVDPHGNLLVNCDNITRRVSAGEVFLCS